MFRATAVCILSLVLSLACASAALAKKQAQPSNINFGTITCNEFVQGVAESDDAESIGIILVWIDGYLSGVSGDTTLNWKNLEQFSSRFVEACQKTPNRKALDVARDVGIRK